MVKWWVRTGLHLYFGKIKISGLQNVPKNKPVLFLPNHQSALLDVLLIAVDCNRKPYFLTRSDVFKGNFLNSVFAYFQMIPIYRIRDGRESLKNNQAVFDTCADLLRNNEAILMFPEANHNLKRRIRPLSKGFTRILFNTLESAPELDIQIIPVGVNYQDSLLFPGKVALNFGQPLSVKDCYNINDIRSSVESLKSLVSSSLKGLTTHVEDEENYDAILKQLNATGVNFLDPTTVNKKITDFAPSEVLVGDEYSSVKKTNLLKELFRGLFKLLNLPILLIWKKMVKPKVWEPEFMGTLRFGFALLAYPFYYLILLFVLSFTMNTTTAFIAVLFLFFFNWLYTRLS